MKYPWMGLVFLLLAGAVEAGDIALRAHVPNMPAIHWQD